MCGSYSAFFAAQITGSHPLGRINSGPTFAPRSDRKPPKNLLPQFHHLTIAFREGAALAGAFQAVLRMERRITRDGSLGQRQSL
jgi:hypothetical protein